MPKRTTKAAAPVQAQPAASAPSLPTTKGKLGRLIELLQRPEGARIDELIAVTGWQAHSVRGAISGALKKERGLTVTSEKIEAGRVYRIIPGEPA